MISSSITTYANNIGLHYLMKYKASINLIKFKWYAIGGNCI